MKKEELMNQKMDDQELDHIAAGNAGECNEIEAWRFICGQDDGNDSNLHPSHSSLGAGFLESWRMQAFVEAAIRGEPAVKVLRPVVIPLARKTPTLMWMAMGIT